MELNILRPCLGAEVMLLPQEHMLRIEGIGSVAPIVWDLTGPPLGFHASSSQFVSSAFPASNVSTTAMGRALSSPKSSRITVLSAQGIAVEKKLCRSGPGNSKPLTLFEGLTRTGPYQSKKEKKTFRLPCFHQLHQLHRCLVQELHGGLISEATGHRWTISHASRGYQSLPRHPNHAEAFEKLPAAELEEHEKPSQLSRGFLEATQMLRRIILP